MAALRVLAYAEGTTYLALLAGSLQHRLLDGADLTLPLGLIHGVVFLAFAALVLVARRPLGWDGARTAMALGASILPGGGYVVARDLG